MIAKGTAHNHGAKFGRYMTEAGKDNERAELYQLRGFAEDNIIDAFRTVQGISAGTRCTQPLFHCQIRTPAGENLTREQWEHVADRIEKKLGLIDQPRAIAFHLKDGHEHMHVAWSRIDEVTMTAKPLPFFKLRLKEVCRELEVELDLTRVRNHREPGELKAPTRDEYEQASRLGVDPKAIHAEIREAWERSDSGQAFAAALADRGLMLAKGERRDYVVIDHEGGLHALGKRILGTSAAETRERMTDLSRDTLPTVEKAREQQQARVAEGRSPALVKKISDSGAIEAAAPKVMGEEKERKTMRAEPTGRSYSAFSAILDAGKPENVALKVADGVTGTVATLADFICDLLIGSSAPPQRDPNQRLVEQIIEQRRTDAALERIRESMARGHGLSAADICSLSRDQLENIQAKGDDGLRSMIAQMERDRARGRDDDEKTRER